MKRFDFASFSSFEGPQEEQDFQVLVIKTTEFHDFVNNYYNFMIIVKNFVI